ncbi:hypothetical protein ACKWTF_004876 [Chironomus riparius]
MMKLNELVLCILITISNLCVNASDDTTTYKYPEIHHRNWTRSEKLDQNGILNLQWYIRDSEVIFNVILNSRGFVAIGFPYPNTQIKGFDVVLAWVNDKTGKANILDCHGTSSKFEEKVIVRDDTQNYILENEGYQNLTHTILTFKRSFSTCDPRDVPFTADTMKMFWAYGEKDVTQLDRMSFKAKGSRPIYLLNPSSTKPKDTSVFQWDVAMKEVKITQDVGSVYWCKIFEAPKHPKEHIIGFEPILSRDKDTKRQFVHHMTLFECKFSAKHFDPDAISKNSEDLKKWSKSNGIECGSTLYLNGNWDSCVTPVATYSYGGSSHFLPEHVGIPFTESFYMLEIHYVNPNKKNFLDHSGFRVHYVNEMRQFDAGIMINGVSVSDTQFIPPKQPTFRNIGICGPSCTENVFPEEGINIVSVSVHTHVAGRNVKLSHIRAGKEVTRIIDDNHYSHNYQEIRQLENETKVLPGDFMVLECSYNTEGLDKPTLGGYSLHEEMCLSIITYYPKTELVGCYSMVPVKEFFEYFNVRAFHGVTMTDVENIIIYGLDTVQLNRSLLSSDSALSNEIRSSIDEEQEYYQNSILTRLIISDPVEFHDRTFMTHIKQLPWDDQSFTQKFEIVMSTGSYMLFCRTANKSISIPQEIIKYPNFTELKDTKTSSCPHYIYQELLSSSSNSQTLNFTVILYSLIILKILF